MNTDNKSENRSFVLFSILLILLGAAAAYLAFLVIGMDNWLTVIGPATVIVCFDLFFIFYLGERIKEKFKRGSIFFVCLFLPSAAFFVSLLPIDELISSVIFVSVIIICAKCDFYSSQILLLSLIGSLALFNPDQIIPQLPTIFAAICACILVSKSEDSHSVVPSLFITVMFYVIIAVLTSDFILIDTFTGSFALVGVIIICAIVGAFFLHFHEIELSEAALPASETVSKHLTRKEAQDIRNENSNLKNRITKLNDQNCKLAEEYEEFKKTFELYKKEVASVVPANPVLTKVSLSHINSRQFAFTKDLESLNPKLYRHSMEVARISSEASELIGCDTELANAIGLCHEAHRILGEDYVHILSEKYAIPGYVARIVELTRNKANTKPIPREAGIVMMTDDIINTVNYLKSSKKESIPMERIVTNTIKVRKDQNVLRLAGFTNEEIQLLKLYLIEAGGKYVPSD